MFFLRRNTCVSRFRFFNDELGVNPEGFFLLNKIIFSLNDNFEISSSKVSFSGFFSGDEISGG
jgi:hypothetical protein